MVDKVVVFEDTRVDQLYPLTLTRPAFDLRCGILSLREKVAHAFPESTLGVLCRDYLNEMVCQDRGLAASTGADADACLFVNSRLLNVFDLPDVSKTTQTIFYCGDAIVAANLKGPSVHAFSESLRKKGRVDLPGVKHSDVADARLISYPWDLVNNNAVEIKRDFERFAVGGHNLGEISDRATLLNLAQIYIGKGSTVAPGAVLDATDGPIHIAENVKIMAQAVIAGPASIGDNSVVRVGAKIYEGSSIGAVCKVGGEVEASIIHSFSNKQHDGFLGHSYIGQWVNLGADTNNSDLKNNYGSVKVWVNGDLVDSGSSFVGLFMGDHSKAGINTMFNTGTSVGVMCNVFGGGFPPKLIPSFSWGGSGGFEEHKLEKALETAEIVMGRRGCQLTPAQRKVLRHVFEMRQADLPV